MLQSSEALGQSAAAYKSETRSFGGASGTRGWPYDAHQSMPLQVGQYGGIQMKRQDDLSELWRSRADNGSVLGQSQPMSAQNQASRLSSMF